MNLQKRIASILGATLLFSLPACSSQTNDVPAPETEEVSEEVVEEVTPKLWTGKNLTENEKKVLKFLQEYGITDKVALATIMGNIKQESKFETRICEGGARVGYGSCRSGGFGLIQWTTAGRYRGLGSYASAKGLSPDSLEAQLGWLVNEREWRLVEHIFKTEGLSQQSYMNAAYRWLGWGVTGNRNYYTNAYLNSFYQL